jgi:hypothetical protein
MVSFHSFSPLCVFSVYAESNFLKHKKPFHATVPLRKLVHCVTLFITNQMRHLFLLIIEKRNIEENPGTPTPPLYSFVNVSTLRQVLERGDVIKTIVMCFPRVQVSVLTVLM